MSLANIAAVRGQKPLEHGEFCQSDTGKPRPQESEFCTDGVIWEKYVSLVFSMSLLNVIDSTLCLTSFALRRVISASCLMHYHNDITHSHCYVRNWIKWRSSRWACIQEKGGAEEAGLSMLGSVALRPSHKPLINAVGEQKNSFKELTKKPQPFLLGGRSEKSGCAEIS